MPISKTARIDDLVTANKLIPPDVLACEGELLTTKWFAYRFMSPLAATLEFARLYNEGLKDFLRTNVDVDFANRVNGVRIRVPRTRDRYFTQLWKARQRADEFFMPYEQIIEFGFDFASRRKRRFAPNPLQLFPATTSHDAWYWKFEEFLEDRSPYLLDTGCDLPQYRAEHFVGLPAQTDYRYHLREHAKSGTRRWSHAIASTCLARRELLVEDLIELVPEHLQDEAVNEAHAEFEAGYHAELPVVSIADSDLYQSCFGVREARSNMNSNCGACPHADACSAFADEVASETVRICGTASPVIADKRAKQRERTARCRAKKAALASSAGPAVAASANA